MSKEEQVLKVFQEAINEAQNRKEYLTHQEWVKLLSKLDEIDVQLADDFFSADMDIETNKKFFSTDGPEYDAVETIAEEYREGHFDGMTDSYEYKKDRGQNKPGAKYISVNKHFSEGEIKRLKDRAEELGILSRCMNDWGEFRPILAEKAIREELQRKEEQKPETKPEKQQTSNIIMVDFISRRKIS